MSAADRIAINAAKSRIREHARRQAADLVGDAARAYHANVRALQTKQITADEHRSTNREIRSNLTDNEWERAKATALNQI